MCSSHHATYATTEQIVVPVGVSDRHNLSPQFVQLTGQLSSLNSYSVASIFTAFTWGLQRVQFGSVQFITWCEHLWHISFHHRSTHYMGWHVTEWTWGDSIDHLNIALLSDLSVKRYSSDYDNVFVGLACSSFTLSQETWFWKTED